MTKEEWKKVEDWWGTGFGSVEMSVDGHEISLYNNIDKKKMVVEVVIYVDGYIKGEYSTAGNETGDRFWNRARKPLYSLKELRERAEIWGKRSKEARQQHFEYNYPYWRSFAAFRKHITAHNTEINLIPKSEASDERENQ